MKYEDAEQLKVHMLEWCITLVSQHHKWECEEMSVYCENTHKTKLGNQCMFKSCNGQRQKCWLNVDTVSNILTNVDTVSNILTNVLSPKLSMMLYYSITYMYHCAIVNIFVSIGTTITA